MSDVTEKAACQKFINEFAKDILKKAGFPGEFVRAQELGIHNRWRLSNDKGPPLEVHLFTLVEDALGVRHRLMDPGTLFSPEFTEDDLLASLEELGIENGDVTKLVERIAKMGEW